MEFEAMLSQLPNFAGLVICILYLWRDGERKSAHIDFLVNTIIKKENCDEPSTENNARSK